METITCSRCHQSWSNLEWQQSLDGICCYIYDKCGHCSPFYKEKTKAKLYGYLINELAGSNQNVWVNEESNILANIVTKYKLDIVLSKVKSIRQEATLISEKPMENGIENGIENDDEMSDYFINRSL